MCVLCSSFPGLAVHGNGVSNEFEVGPVFAAVEAGGAGASAAASGGSTISQNVSGLLSGYQWNSAITYSFPTSSSTYGTNYGEGENTSNFSALSATEQQLVQTIMGQVSSFTNLTILFVGNGSADIRLAHSSASNPTAYAYYPGSNEGGDIWFGTSYNYTQPRTGDYSTVIHYHEIGHALGLKHSHEIGGPAFTNVSLAYDSLEYTVMSYRSYEGSPLFGYRNEQYGYPSSFMMLDIAALQELYGADYSLNSGNTVYSWSAISGQALIDGVAQALPGTNRIFSTVWDGGGTDTYDLSNYNSAVTIDLNPGGYTITSANQLANLGNGHKAHGNVYNALLFHDDASSYIENAIGGSGNDTISGNAVANELRGGLGNDTLDGRAGNDTLIGGAGNDTFVFANDYGRDIIADFSVGSDKVILRGHSGIEDFADILAHAAQVGSNTVITFSSDEILTFQNLNLGNLTSSNFTIEKAPPTPLTEIVMLGGVATAVVNASFDDATVHKAPPSLIVSLSDGSELYTYLERLQFDDAIVAFDFSGTAGLAYRLYQAAFGRAPDVEGLSGNIHLLDTQLNYLEMSAAFVASAEFQAMYGNHLTNAQFVFNLYDNVLGRIPEQDGFDAWVALLDSGQQTRAGVLIGFSESPENHTLVDPAMATGIVLDPNYFI